MKRYFTDTTTNATYILLQIVYDGVDGCARLYLADTSTGDIVERSINQVKMIIP